MVYCRYCGNQNQDGSLNCVKCGKPLSLLPNEPQEDLKRRKQNSNPNLDQNRNQNNVSPNNSNYRFKRPIKSKYMNDGENTNISHETRNIGQNSGYFNNENTHNLENRAYNNRDRLNNQNSDLSQFNQIQESERIARNKYRSQNELKVSKTAIEWDVVIATALLVIILTAVLQRIFPFFGIFMALIVGLIYILIATKSKSSLVKSIPLGIVVILAIWAYFSI